MSDIQLSKKEILKGPHDIKINHLADSFITKLTCGEEEQPAGLKVPLSHSLGMQPGGLEEAVPQQMIWAGPGVTS